VIRAGQWPPEQDIHKGIHAAGAMMEISLHSCAFISPKSFRLKKRQDYISWDEYFMGVALLSARRSKDPNTQVGACIVNEKNKIVGAGYNGLPIGCDDDEFPWDKKGDFLNTKYPYICHAELNAILNNIGMDLKGCKIYTALFPCNECTKAIIQSGIKEVIYLSDKYEGTDAARASRLMLERSGVSYRKVVAGIDSLRLSFNEADV
jgi:dCMP deaminase